MTERSRQLEISLRLKAARWLAGSQRVSAKSTTGKEQAVALSPEELASRSPLPENRITANKIREIEEMKTFVPPSQITLISEALGFDFDALPLPEPAAVTQKLDALEQALTEAVQDLVRETEPAVTSALERGLKDASRESRAG